MYFSLCYVFLLSFFCVFLSFLSKHFNMACFKYKINYEVM